MIVRCFVSHDWFSGQMCSGISDTASPLGALLWSTYCTSTWLMLLVCFVSQGLQYTFWLTAMCWLPDFLCRLGHAAVAERLHHPGPGCRLRVSERQNEELHEPEGVCKAAAKKHSGCRGGLQPLRHCTVLCYAATSPAASVHWYRQADDQ